MLPLEISLAANEEEVQSRVGRTVFVKSVTGEIEVTGYSAGGILVGKARMVQGNRYVMAADFTRLQIKDLSGATNNVQLLAGLGDFSEAGLGTIDSITDPVSTQFEMDAGYSSEFASGGTKTFGLSGSGFPNGIIVYTLCLTHDAAVGNSVFSYFDENSLAFLAEIAGPSQSYQFAGRWLLPPKPAGYRIVAGTGGQASVFFGAR